MNNWTGKKLINEDLQKVQDINIMDTNLANERNKIFKLPKSLKSPKIKFDF